MKDELLRSERRKVLRLMQRAYVSYAQQYILLYIAYNAWYQCVTGTINERKAHTLLKSRHQLWDEYERGRGMYGLRSVMELLVDATQREPFAASRSWGGEVGGVYDWPSLIEFWYQVRCTIVHGGEVPEGLARMAYDSLQIFMNEALKKEARTPLLTP